MGLAVYNSITLDVRFPPICFRKLLSPAVVPYNLPKATVGICKVSVRDFTLTMPVSPIFPNLMFAMNGCIYIYIYIYTVIDFQGWRSR